MSKFDLQGKRLLITRPRAKAKSTADLVRAHNGSPEIFPTIRITGPTSWDAVDSSIESLEDFSWVIFSSGYGVRYYIQRLDTLGKSLPVSLRVAAVGSKTASALEKRGVRVDLVPEHFTADHLLRAFEEIPLSGNNILHVTGNKGRRTLQRGLESMGARVQRAEAYRNVQPSHESVKSLVRKLEQGKLDCLTFTSPSTFHNLWNILAGETDSPEELLNSCVIAAIGPVTAGAIESYGVSVTVIPGESTVEGMIQAVAEMTDTEVHHHLETHDDKGQ